MILFGDVDRGGADFAMAFLGTKDLSIDDLILVADPASTQLPVVPSEYLFV